jgi:polyhydroxybutyrate depolymerase
MKYSVRVKKANCIYVVFILIVFIPLIIFAQTITDSFNFKGVTRDYIVHLPPNYEPNMPVLFNLHGGLDYRAQWHMEYTLMNDVADTAGFIVVYPYSLEWYWNVNIFDPEEPEVDDVGFISALIDTLEAAYDIDMNRIYCSGGFLGGTMTHHLIGQIGYRFAAGAAVIAPLGDYTAANWNFTRPFPILMCYGTHDPDLPWDGSRPGFTSPDSNLNFWVQKNVCLLPADTVTLPDIDPSDNCTVEKISYTDCFGNIKILFYKVINGGHSWPGACCDYHWGEHTNRDINTSVEIWNFVKNYQLMPMAYAKNVSVNKTYVKPGSDTLGIKAQIENPNQHTLSVLAIIQNKDGQTSDSCYFADDGNHEDNDAGDGIWGGLWPVPSGETNYSLNIKTKSLDNDQYTLSYDNNVPDFVTTGPLVYTGWTPYILEDSVANPGDLLSFKIYLRNDGQDSKVEDIEARLTTDDPRITLHNFYSTFGNIGAGATVESNQGYSIQLSSDFTENTTIYFTLRISSNGTHYWSDLMPLDIVTNIPTQDRALPESYVLEQNYPNPFNPKTIINYELPIAYEVELSIYNLIGQKVATLISEKQRPGHHKVEWDATGFVSGIYYYVLKAGDYRDVKKMVLLR